MEKVLGKTYRQELLSLPVSSDGSIHAGENGIEAIYTPADRKVEFFLTKESIYCSVPQFIHCVHQYIILPPKQC